MSNNNTPRSTQYLPQMAVATTVVAVLPVLVVWLLLIERVISSPWVCVGLAIALSFTASILGSAYWKRRSGPEDVLFSELLLWGWLHRFQSERRLAKAVGLLGLADAETSLTEGNQSFGQSGETLRQLAAALDAKDPYTDGHSRRVALHAAMVARKMGLSNEDVAEIRTAAAVHDIGKLRIPLEILNKQTALTAAEFEIVKRHADEGADIVSRMNDPQISAMVRHHHERFDGTGYPAGLMGEQIPVGARIIAVADTFDALTSERPYRAAIPHKQALEVVVSVSGTQLDPVAVRAFVKCYSGKRAILFWTLLAVSPQRALAFVRGRSVGRTNLGSVATVAMPAALAAVVAAAFGGAGSVVRAQTPLRFAQRPAAGTVARTKKAAGDPRGSTHATRASSHAKAAVLGSTVTRNTPAATGNRAAGAGSSPNSRGGSGGSPGSSRAGSSPTSGAGSGGRRGGGSRPGGGTVPVVSSPKPGAGGSGGHPPVNPGSPGGPPPPPSTTPPAGGSGGGTGSGGGGGGGSGGGGSGGGGSGGGGSGGGGSGNPGGPQPQSKQDCKADGWTNFGFPNQGLCVAWVEHHVLHLALSLG